MNNYDRIATVDISIEAAVADSSSYDNLLIIGPLPAAETDESPDKVGVYTSLDDVEDAGWITSGDDADPVGLAAYIAFSQSTPPSELYIAPIQVTDDEEESAVDTLQRAIDYDGWYVACPVGVEDDEIVLMAELIENYEKMMVYTELDFFANDLTPVVSASYYRTAGIYGRVTSDQEDEDIPEENKYLNVAFAVAWLAYESGSETAAFKTLTGPTPSTLSATEMDELEEANLCYFITIGGKDVSMIGKVLAGEWMDIIRFRDWLKNDMQVGLVKLFVANPKVPYTDAGIALVQNKMEESLKLGQERGGIAESEYDEDGNETPGYSVSVPLVSSIDSVTRSTRKLTDCTFRARLNGAIHFAEVSGTLAYSL